MNTSFLRNAVVLGLLSAVGPFAIDMYLPAFPAIAEDLDADISLVQMSLTSYFAAVAIFQVIYGPISDAIGRKSPLYFGLALYIAGALGCSFAVNAGMLIGFRFLQGIGGCAAIVITRAIVRDLHTGAEAAKLMATIMLVFSIAPLLAPIAGSTLAALAAWRAIFWVIALIGLAGVVLTMFFLPETRPPERRNPGRLSTVGRDYLSLLRNGHFMGLAFIGGLGQAAFFAYLGGSSGIFIEHFGLSPIGFSVVFALNAMAFIGAAQFNSAFIRRFGAGRVVATSVLMLLVVVGLLLLTTLVGVDNLGALCAMLFLSFACLGLIIPAAAVLALDPHGPIAGTASALMGTLQLGTGAVAIGIVSATFDGTTLPMVAVMASCAAGAFILSLLTLGRGRERLQHPVPSAAETVAEMPSGMSEL